MLAEGEIAVRRDHGKSSTPFDGVSDESADIDPLAEQRK
jgi:hypothetical protein